MRIKDAISAMKAGKERAPERKINELSTIWSEQAPAGETITDYPRPQLKRRDWTCLNGWWHYAFTETSARPEQFDGQILVPFCPESSRSGVKRQLHPGAYLWYFRTIELDAIPEGKRLLLHFGAVDERCIIWWNGKLLGSHMGGYLPFSFDVTQQIREGKNTLWLRVQDDTDVSGAACGKQKLHPGGMFYTAVSGIWQTVWMEWVPEQYVEGLQIRPRYDEEQIHLEVMLSAPQDTEVIVQGRWTSYCHPIRSEEFEWISDGTGHRTDCTAAKCAVARLTLDLPEFHPWSPEDPFLYGLVIESGSDRVESYFAMRKFSTGKDAKGHPRLMLNDQPYFFQGVLDQGYWPESLYTAPSDEAMVYDITKMKELGFNTLRKHVKIEPLRWYYHCDRLGMVVWQDMVNGGAINPVLMTYLPNIVPILTHKVRDSHYRLFARSDAKARTQWKQDCLDTVSHLGNCPCIGLWTIFNEGWGQFDSLAIAQAVQKEDPDRLIDPSSGWFDQGGPYVKSVHNYFRKLRVEKEKRPFLLSEYGGYSYAVAGHTYASSSFGYRSCRSQEQFAAEYRKLQKKIRRLEKKGLSAAIYTQLSDIEEEVNGLLTYDRKCTKI